MQLLWLACLFLGDVNHIILNKPVTLKMVTLHKIEDTYVSKNLKRESAIMEKLNHPNIVSLHEVVFVIYFYWWLVADFVPWRQSLRLSWKREYRALRGGEEQVGLQLWSSFLWRRWQWWDVNEHDRDDEGSFSAEIQKRKNNVCSGGSLSSSTRSRHPRPTLHKISPSGDQVFVKLSCNDGGDRSQWWCRRWC